jgi:phenylacetate-CoA ligase
MINSFIKRKIFYKSPKFLKKILLIIPTKYKIGFSSFNNELKKINESSRIIDEFSLEEYYVSQINEVLKIAKGYQFYQDLYKENGITNFKINSLEEFERFPIISKNQIRNSNYIDEVKRKNINLYPANTGGSSGKPFRFFLPSDIYSKIWNYKILAWNKLGYDLGDSVLSFRGHNFNELFQHQTIYNFYYVDSYKLNKENVFELIKLIKKKKIKYLHGYPSNLLNFAFLIENFKIEFPISGIFTASEMINFPDKTRLEFIFNSKVLSTFEQSESTIFAHRDNFKEGYKFSPSYGYPELKNRKLIATSFVNTVMPLIKYDTGDLCNELIFEDKFIRTNEIVGRESEILKINNKFISITGIIYGQHLPIFEYSISIQVYVNNNSFYLIICSHSTIPEESIIKTKSILDKIIAPELKSEVLITDKSLKTKAGKLKILISKEDFLQIHNS